MGFLVVPQARVHVTLAEEQQAADYFQPVKGIIGA